MTFGCKVKTKDKDYEGKPVSFLIKSHFGIKCSNTGYDAVEDNVSIFIPFGGGFNRGKFKPVCSFSKNKMEIIGHDVLLSDVLNWKDKNGGIWDISNGNITYCQEIVRLWDLSKPTLKDQSDELIDFIYFLVK